jgi:mitogen-activated protein kinase organizer 1
MKMGDGNPQGPGDFPSIPKKESATLKGHEGAVLSVRFNYDGKYCLTTGKDRSIKLWNPHKGLGIKSYLGHGHEVRDVAAARWVHPNAIV